MKKIWFLVTFILITSFFTLGAVFAQRGSTQAQNDSVVNIRLASLLPRNSDWGRALDRLAADVGRATGNQVRVFVNHDGRDGSETEMLRKLNSNALQIGLFTSAGIAELCPAVMNLSVPFMIQNNTELDLVLKDIQPILESRVKSDYVILAWSKGGWLYIFSKDKIMLPEELRKSKLATSPDLNDMNTVFRTMGFQLVEADMVSIGQRLASNMINSIYMIPAAIAPMQIHRYLGHMLDLPISPIMGALVMNKVTWNKLSPKQQQDILNVTRSIASEFDVSMARTEANAISSMGKDGLSVNKLTAEQRNIWQADFDKTLPTLVGPIFDRDIYNRIQGILKNSRSGQ